MQKKIVINVQQLPNGMWTGSIWFGWENCPDSCIFNITRHTQLDVINECISEMEIQRHTLTK